MSRSKIPRSVFIQFSDPTLQRVALEAFLAAGWESESQEKANISITNDDLLKLDKPFRIGQLLDFSDQRYRFSMKSPEIFTVGVVTLLISQSIYSDDKRENIRLTDKEREVLQALLCAPNYQLQRDDLLRDVWGYVQGIETHTLETTIYRLRQKIEEDVDHPQKLLTVQDGYKFNPH